MLVIIVRQMALDRWNVHRRREVVHHAVEHQLDTFVLERRTAEHGEDGTGQSRLPDGAPDLVVGEFGSAQVALEELLVVLHCRFEQLMSHLEDLGT